MTFYILKDDDDDDVSFLRKFMPISVSSEVTGILYDYMKVL